MTQDTAADEKRIQYLGEAYATERALTRVLQEQIAVTPTGGYRDALEQHLRETRTHADRVRERLSDVGGGAGPAEQVGLVVQSLLAQAVALAKAPLDLLRGSGGEEKVLKNAKDAAATEALEIATYTALEQLAEHLGDDDTARLAREIRADEERMLERILAEIPQLTGKVVRADVRGSHTYDPSRTGAGEAVRDVATTARDAAQAVGGAARKVPGAATVEGTVRGAVADGNGLPIAGYDDLTAEEIVARLPALAQRDLVAVETYELNHADRSTVTARIDQLRGDEPWPGYDELTVAQVRAALSDAGDHELARRVAAYERRHKDRSGVLQLVGDGANAA